MSCKRVCTLNIGQGGSQNQRQICCSCSGPATVPSVACVSVNSPKRFAEIMAQGPPAAAEGEPTGPPQQGRGVRGQYVYWIVFSHPKPETVERLGIKVPTDFDRKTFSQLVVAAHQECGISIVETASFQEPHANGLIHHNCLVRALKQYRWAPIAALLRAEHKVCVAFGSNIKTWAEGVVYGRVASEHKKPEELDKDPVQWARAGEPAGFDQFIPRSWQKEGYQRKTKMSHLAFLDICREHSVTSEVAAWALAEQLEKRGDRGLMAYLLENDPAAVLSKVRSAMSAFDENRRGQLGRMQILQEVLAQNACSCSSAGECYRLMKQVLVNNKLDGNFQREVVATLQAGRLKMRNLCLVGGPGTAKSYLFKPLAVIFNAYSRPDGGSYQLETLLGKEIVFLNDLEYDEDAKKWCPWGYLKRFLEGEPLPVACPKNRGGNKMFTSDAPVFITAPQEIALYRGKRRDEYETSQMNARVKYAYLTVSIPEAERKETPPCGHCGARLYLEGVGQMQAVGAAQTQRASSSSAGPSGGVVSSPVVEQIQAPPPKTGLEIVEALKDVMAMKREGLLDTPEAKRLKAKILAGE